ARPRHLRGAGAARRRPRRRMAVDPGGGGPACLCARRPAVGADGRLPRRHRGQRRARRHPRHRAPAGRSDRCRGVRLRRLHHRLGSLDRPGRCVVGGRGGRRHGRRRGQRPRGGAPRPAGHGAAPRRLRCRRHRRPAARDGPPGRRTLVAQRLRVHRRAAGRPARRLPGHPGQLAAGSGRTFRGRDGPGPAPPGRHDAAAHPRLVLRLHRAGDHHRPVGLQPPHRGAGCADDDRRALGGGLLGLAHRRSARDGRRRRAGLGRPPPRGGDGGGAPRDAGAVAGPRRGGRRRPPADRCEPGAGVPHPRVPHARAARRAPRRPRHRLPAQRSRGGSRRAPGRRGAGGWRGGPGGARPEPARHGGGPARAAGGDPAPGETRPPRPGRVDPV
ncbi:MAG: hypothetical protein AVDCRST_MAG20-1446, partial [uncultured Acidimicrobiales bacterium]